MIAFVRGTVEERDETSVVLDNNGIGYRILVPSSVSDRLSAHEEVRLYTYLAVREDAMTLYGFLTHDDRLVFTQLLGVSGIGPKGALSVLSAISANDLRFAVLSDDLKTLGKIPGIGKKTAQKLILELKDKFDLRDALEDHTEEGLPFTAASEGERTAEAEAIEALTALGYPGTQAMKAVRAVTAKGQEMSVEAILKAALKNL